MWSVLPEMTAERTPSNVDVGVINHVAANHQLTMPMLGSEADRYAMTDEADVRRARVIPGKVLDRAAGNLHLSD